MDLYVIFIIYVASSVVGLFMLFGKICEIERHLFFMSVRIKYCFDEKMKINLYDEKMKINLYDEYEEDEIGLMRKKEK